MYNIPSKQKKNNHYNTINKKYKILVKTQIYDIVDQLDKNS